MGRIEGVIKQAIAKQTQLTTLNVTLEINEISVIIRSSSCKSAKCTNHLHENDKLCKCQNNVLFTNKFSDISSCGKINSNELYFCYIAGDTFCTLSQQFKGYVFESRSSTQAKLVLNNIYQGFKRTTWFMWLKFFSTVVNLFRRLYFIDCNCNHWYFFQFQFQLKCLSCGDLNGIFAAMKYEIYIIYCSCRLISYSFHLKNFILKNSYRI